MSVQAPVLYIPHGGGPLPLLGDPGHDELVAFWRTIPARLGKPAALLVISAHWETAVPTVTTAARPPLLFDYSGFPPEAYTLQYPAPGSPALATEIMARLEQAGISARGNAQRGFDHGVFIPLSIMYPEANIPIVQLSLLRSLDPREHIRLGRALRELRNQNILIVGSGSSFHNVSAFFGARSKRGKQGSAFQEWLLETCTAPTLTEREREERLIHWQEAPEARFCHPRAEHLLPLQVCFGIAGGPAEGVFQDRVMDYPVVSLLWG